jgi:hypothetical protein
MVTPHDKLAKMWITNNVPDPQYLGNSFAVEPRYIQQLAYGMLTDGCKVDMDGKTLILGPQAEVVFATVN